MPFQHALYRIGDGLRRLSSATLASEAELEQYIAQDVKILDDRWMIIGRQVRTSFDKRIDLLAIDEDGTLIIIELKRDRTPREVVAQALDYASWVETLDRAQVAEVWQSYVTTYRKDLLTQSLDAAFKAHFGLDLGDVELNEDHQMVIVAARLDDSTERIVTYLSDRDIPINAVFFEVFADGAQRFLSRVWFRDPMLVQAALANPPREREPWNNEFYVSFGHGDRRHWEDAMKYGFIAAGGGSWYSATLRSLAKGDRVWVNVPRRGYVGVGVVDEPAVRVSEFEVPRTDGTRGPLTSAMVQAPSMFKDHDDEELAEYLVRVRWVKALPLAQAVKETGFFGNQNSVCKPTALKWKHTVERLTQVWKIAP